MIQEAYEKALEKYLPRDDVTGVMIGLKFKDGKWTDEKCISIRVKKKKPLEELEESEVVEKTILGEKTDVLEANIQPLIINNRLKMDIACPGLSIGPEEANSTGSIGCIVFKNSIPYYLTCFHVAVPTGTMLDPQYIKQPGIADNGVDQYDRIGVLDQYNVSSRGDFALITVDENFRHYGTVPFNTNVIFTTARIPEINEIIEKTGRTTGYTVGKVSAIGTVAIDYSPWGRGTVNISGFEVVPLTDPNEEIVLSGDSGSAGWIQDSTIAAGILTGGSWNPTVAFYSLVVNALEDYSATITSDKAVWKPKDEILSNFFQIGWITPNIENVYEFALTFNDSYKNVFLYTDPAYAEILWGKLSTDTVYYNIGAFSNSPSCILGDMVKNATVTVQIKIINTLNIVGDQNIPIDIGYGDSIIQGDWNVSEPLTVSSGSTGNWPPHTHKDNDTGGATVVGIPPDHEVNGTNDAIKFQKSDGSWNDWLTLESLGEGSPPIIFAGPDWTSFTHLSGSSTWERWYSPMIPDTVSGSYAMAADYISGVPFICSRGGTIDRLGLAAPATVPGGNQLVRLGIYDSVSNSNLYPNNLIVDSGEITVSAVQVYTKVVSFELERGKLYWFVALCDACTAGSILYYFVDMSYYTSTFPLWTMLGMNSDMSGLAAGFKNSMTYGTLPNPMPPGLTINDQSVPGGGGASGLAAVGMRYSA